MKYIGYIVTKHYDKDTKPVDSPHRLFETIFLKPEYNIKIKNNRPDVLPIYTNEKEAIADSEWWPGHTNEDYGVVKKVTITIEEDTHNTIESERKTINNLIKKTSNKDNLQHLNDNLKELDWYQK
jgi:hypothetical protein|tara:strand:- start:225 stop:599 length:375 start_codon:yes stop_codon:yes gene_type:complete